MPEADKPNSNVSSILRYFVYEHLKSETMRNVSRQFYLIAHDMEDKLPNGPEKSVALRKLLEAKDAAVRSVIDAE